MIISFKVACRSTVCCLILATVGVSLTSCQSSVEAEHLEHAVPDHKPLSYADSVGQLQQRIGELLETEITEVPDAHEISELGDIIRWLPENAADSDLKKDAWEQVNQISQRLALWQQSLANRSSHPDDPSHSQLKIDLHQLQSFIESSNQSFLPTSQTRPDH